jgi:hypothetical protein
MYFQAAAAALARTRAEERAAEAIKEAAGVKATLEQRSHELRT